MPYKEIPPDFLPEGFLYMASEDIPFSLPTKLFVGVTAATALKVHRKV